MLSIKNHSLTEVKRRISTIHKIGIKLFVRIDVSLTPLTYTENRKPIKNILFIHHYYTLEEEILMIQLQDIEQAMTVKLDDFLPEKTIFQEGIRRAPDRGFRLT